VSATFSEAMTAATITTSTFTLATTSGSTPVTGTVALAGNVATFTPGANLSYGTSYTATVTTGAQDSAGNALAAASTWSFTTVPTFTISGTVTGPYVEGVTITMSGGATDTAVTNASGAYSFATSRPAGSYTLTPSLAGYTYSPSAPVVVVSANTTQNFVASSAVASYSITGTVSYAGAKTGRIRIQAFNSTGGGNAVAGITIASPGAYTIRGLQNGSYVVKASMGYLGTGAPNATNPSGASATVSVSSANLVVADIAMTDPAAQTATTPTGFFASPGSGVALLLWDPVYNANETEKVTAYKIYWGTDTLATNGAPIVVGARDDALYIQSGLTDSSQVYYKIASCVSDDLLCTSGEGTASAVVGPVTIGATTGLNTVAGTVTFPGTPSGHLIVAVYNPVGAIIELTRLPVTASPMSYSIAGVASGTLGALILIDANDNGIPDAGELKAGGDGASFTVSGNTTQNFTLTTTGANATVGTRIFSNGIDAAGYSLNLKVGDGYKRVRDVTLVSGLNVALPLDMGKDWRFQAYPWIGATVPTVGSTYKFKVTFSDGTTETLSSSVTGVLGLSNMAQTLGVTTDGTSSSSVTVPLFTWATPSSEPASYTYNVRVTTTSYSQMWETNNNLPSGTLSVLYDVDGNASSASLTSATSYYWQVTVEDANGNQASKQATYTTP
jgi:hypothetical protein